MSNASVPDKERPGLAKLPNPERLRLLCIDCAHHSLIDMGALKPLTHACDVEKLFDQVDGKPLFRACSLARNNSDICGPYATKFQPKQASET